MMQVLSCIVVEHDIWLVLLAAVVCVAGCWISMRLHGRALSTNRGQRLGWLFLASAACGSSIWCTHFIAMLGFESPAPVRFDAVLTIASLMIAMVATFAGLLVSCGRRARAMPAIGGAVIGLGIAAMHYTGMMAYRVVGLVEWIDGYIFTSVVLSVLFSAAAIEVACRRSIPGNRSAAATLLVMGIVSLHFTAMTAFRVTPMAEAFAANDAGAFQAMAIAVAAVGMMIAAVGLTSYLVEGQTRSDAYDRLHHMAMHDALTGLPNRNRFNDHLDRSIAAALEAGTRFAVIAIDLNRFKEVNDSRGHAAGDEVLRTLARRMLALDSPGVFHARVGGDEFVAVAELRHGRLLCDVLDPLKAAFFAPVKLDDSEATTGASFGVALFPKDGSDREALLRNADIAMYRAKASTADSVCYYDVSIDELARSQRALVKDLRHAIERDQLEVHYQVQACVTTGDVRGFEALLRWRHPERGFVPPAEFIPLAEQDGLIIELGNWVMRQACREACSWDPRHKVAINLSPIQIAQADLPKTVQRILSETGLPPNRLELELTESAIIRDKKQCLHVLQQIKALGASIALDDFGTGYSSLDTLRSFPFDRIKLDRSFVVEIDTSQQAKAIVRAVLALGKCLGVAVLAEGVETEVQLSALEDEGCDEAQGYFLGRPVPPSDRPTEVRLPVLIGYQARNVRIADDLALAATPA